jgi:hypothetical protein
VAPTTTEQANEAFINAMRRAQEVDLTRPYVWSVGLGRWVNSGCSGCECHIPDASPETTALIARLDRELGE